MGKGHSTDYGNGFSGKDYTDGDGKHNALGWETDKGGANHCHAWANDTKGDLVSGVVHRGGCEQCNDQKSDGGGSGK